MPNNAKVSLTSITVSGIDIAEGGYMQTGES